MSGSGSKQTGRMNLDAYILERLYNAALSIEKAVERNKLETILFSSINDVSGVVDSALHIAYQMVKWNQKVLLINVDESSEFSFQKYLELQNRAKLLGTLQNSSYLSESISSTQYPFLDYIGIEDFKSEEAVRIFTEYKFYERLVPLRNYYDRIIFVGPEYEKNIDYSKIFRLADSAVTVPKNGTSDYRKLQKYFKELELCAVYSLGMIRHK